MRSLKYLIAACLLWSLALNVTLAQTQQVPNKPAPKGLNKSDASKNNSSKVPVEPALSPHEMNIAEKVHVGQLPCELGASVRMSADEKSPGYFNLQGKGYKYRMKPVATSTGAIRLEDEKAGAVWLQLANKSMLMDQKNGRRLADECAHPDQVAFANEMKRNPPPALIDVSNSASPSPR
jgi:hypothetical protein